MELRVTNNCSDTITELVLAYFSSLPSNVITPDARVISYNLPAIRVRVSPARSTMVEINTSVRVANPYSSSEGLETVCD